MVEALSNVESLLLKCDIWWSLVVIDSLVKSVLAAEVPSQAGGTRACRVP